MSSLRAKMTGPNVHMQMARAGFTERECEIMVMDKDFNQAEYDAIVAENPTHWFFAGGAYPYGGVKSVRFKRMEPGAMELVDAMVSAMNTGATSIEHSCPPGAVSDAINRMDNLRPKTRVGATEISRTFRITLKPQ